MNPTGVRLRVHRVAKENISVIAGVHGELLQASESSSLRSRIVPAAAALPKVFAGIVNQLAE